MNLDELLQIQLEKDLMNDLFKEYKINKKLSDIYSINEFREIIQRKIKIKNKKNLIFIQDKIQVNRLSDRKRCCARIWFHHKGLKCPYSKYKGDYCKKHSNMINNFYNYRSINYYFVVFLYVLYLILQNDT